MWRSEGRPIPSFPNILWTSAARCSALEAGSGGEGQLDLLRNAGGIAHNEGPAAAPSWPLEGGNQVALPSTRRAQEAAKSHGDFAGRPGKRASPTCRPTLSMAQAGERAHLTWPPVRSDQLIERECILAIRARAVLGPCGSVTGGRISLNGLPGHCGSSGS